MLYNDLQSQTLISFGSVLVLNLCIVLFPSMSLNNQGLTIRKMKVQNYPSWNESTTVAVPGRLSKDLSKSVLGGHDEHAHTHTHTHYVLQLESTASVRMGRKCCNWKLNQAVLKQSENVLLEHPMPRSLQIRKKSEQNIHSNSKITIKTKTAHSWHYHMCNYEQLHIPRTIPGSESIDYFSAD